MKNLRRQLLILLAVLAAASSSAGANAPGFDFAKNGPIELLSYLRVNKAKKMLTIDEPVSDWVKEEHIPSLIELLDSDEECMSVALMSSSRIRLGSTIGDEAAFLIEGYRANKYPSALNSRRLEQGEKRAILNWWVRSKGPVKQRPTSASQRQND